VADGFGVAFGQDADGGEVVFLEPVGQVASASGLGSSVYSINWLEWKAWRRCSDRWNSMQAQYLPDVA